MSLSICLSARLCLCVTMWKIASIRHRYSSITVDCLCVSLPGCLPVYVSVTACVIFCRRRRPVSWSLKEKTKEDAAIICREIQSQNDLLAPHHQGKQFILPSGNTEGGVDVSGTGETFPTQCCSGWTVFLSYRVRRQFSTSALCHVVYKLLYED